MAAKTCLDGPSGRGASPSGRLVTGAAPWLVGLAALLAAPTAQANTGFGFFVIAIPILALGFIPITLVEAPILSRLLKVGIRRGLWWSFIANLVSTVLGAVVGVMADMGISAASGLMGGVDAAAMLAGLALMFCVTWWIESSTVRSMLPAGSAQSPLRATFVANAVSYSLLVVALLFVPMPGRDFPRSDARFRITEAMTEMATARTEAFEHFSAQGRLPGPAAIPVKTKYLQSLARNADGRIIGLINYPGVEGLHGTRVILAPRLESGNIVAWDCYTPDADFKFLPANCRNRPPRLPSQ